MAPWRPGSKEGPGTPGRRRRAPGRRPEAPRWHSEGTGRSMASSVIAMATTASEKKTSRSTERRSYSGSSLRHLPINSMYRGPATRTRPARAVRPRCGVVDLGQEQRLAGRLGRDQQQVRPVEGDVVARPRPPADGAMPTAAAAAPTVPFSPTWSVAACWTKPMPPACRRQPGEVRLCSLKACAHAEPLEHRLHVAGAPPVSRFTFGSDTSAVSARAPEPAPARVQRAR